MKFIPFIYICLTALICTHAKAQTKTAHDFGYTHITYTYNNDQVDILVKSQKGDEQKTKPLFFFCQGSLPQPLIKFDETGAYSVFPFDPENLCKDYHLVIVGKPYVPLMVNVKELGQNFTYNDSTGKFPKKYSERNLPDYYVNRNIAVLKFLLKQKWASGNKLVFAGHSEGSTIAAKMAVQFPAVSHLIYSGGNPSGRIMTMISRSRSEETDTDTTRYGEFEFEYWQKTVEQQKNTNDTFGDTYKATYDFSLPPSVYLNKLKIPVLVTYGTKDYSTAYNDLFRAECIRQKKNNFTFKAYIGAEHNYFPVGKNNQPDYSRFGWDNVAEDWRKWLCK